MASDNRQLLRTGSQRLGIPLGDEAIERLLIYLAQLMKWSRRVNLIARDTPEEQAVELHFLDSLTLAPLLQEPEAVHLLDVGTGAGFPGLVLACVLPEARFTLVEPRQKRVSFLRHLIRTLGLSNTEVVADRLEPHAQAWQGRFTHVTSRAVAEPGLFLPLVRPLAIPEARVILMLAREHTLAGIETLASGPWRIAETRAFALPFSGAPRLLAVVCPA
ncbi:methyltransferase GidB [Desulfobulbus propionicus DSM 2032]|uniref:Ribosomal RNA small subunit methyltransferase G n=1 Tax=Desulfobulbus propionicus (strain ATCC 33891 / DSM 2032 / VKM B-1956 / 1pr3) TaxID=577650 RepID=A0A7U4DNM5_DESPD|nr:16S rRNA (guanine(527)-N(7))-methyltransferase RsmG [Desulfobulbus propionicus]ADW17082.1 methyltransferase GidB [Desulfobulbus propionicus DSM 2032]